MSVPRLLALGLAVWLSAGTTMIVGCSPRLTSKDLGEIQTHPSKLPGSGEEYALPEPYFEPGDPLAEAEEDQ